MAFVRTTFQPIIPRKRELNDDSSEVEEFKQQRLAVCKPKIRYGVQVHRDFPPGCGINQDAIGSKADRERVPLKNLGNIDSKPGKVASNDEDDKLKSLKTKELRIQKPGFGSKPPGKVKFWDARCSDAEKPNETDLKPKRLGIEKPGFGSRPPGKVKFWDPNCSVSEKLNETELKPKQLGIEKPSFGSRPPGKVKFWDLNCSVSEKSNETAAVVSRKEQVRRDKIKEAIIMFDEVYGRLYLENKSKQTGEKIAHWRVPVEAAKIVKEKMKWGHVDKILGPVCGVQIGDKFRFRSQLQMVGLHCQPQSGIDYTKIGGQNLAISIVDSNRYSNRRTSCDELYYSGQGGVHFLGCKQDLPEDQKLERGNLALINSKKEKNVVRVIRKLHEVGKSSEVFVYDGLYIVEDCTMKKGAEGKMVFMFHLKRVPGQPQLHKMLNLSNASR